MNTVRTSYVTSNKGQTRRIILQTVKKPNETEQQAKERLEKNVQALREKKEKAC